MIFLPPILFILLFIPFLRNPLCLDGMGEYLKVTTFYTSGLAAYLHEPGLHPPFKAFLASIFFKIFGMSYFSITLMGLVVGIIGVIALYFLAKKLFNREVGVIASLLLAVSPVYLSNGTHSFNDFMLTVSIILSLNFYARGLYVWYAIFATVAALTKEPALLLAISVLVVEFFHKRFSIVRLIFLSAPIILFSLWIQYATAEGIPLFHENIFAATKHKGALFTVIYNLITFDFFHEWAAAHRLVLFYLNFAWVYWLVALWGIGKVVIRKGTKRIGESRPKLAILLFVVSYFFTILTLQTFTSPRYVLPILPFLFLAVAWAIVPIIKSLPLYAYVLVSLFFVVSLFSSVDPLSRVLWGTKPVFGQTLYGFDYVVGPTDSIIYNLQYPLLIRNRKMKLLSLARENKEQYQESLVCNFQY